MCESVSKGAPLALHCWCLKDKRN